MLSFFIRRNRDDYHGYVGSCYRGDDISSKEHVSFREDHRSYWKYKQDLEKEIARKKVEEDPIMTRADGAYIPPGKLRMMQAQINDKSSVAFQRRLENPAVPEGLDLLVEENDQFTHLMSTTEESLDAQDLLSKQNLMLYPTIIINSLSFAQMFSNTTLITR